MFKKRAVKGSVRKREVDNSDGGDEVTSVPPPAPTKSNCIVHKSLAKLGGTALRRRRDSDDDDHNQNDDNTKHKRIKGVPDSIEATAVVDYQPDVCKDFWLTGYCGYGDTCKFLHIRDELRQTAPVTKDWEVDKKEVVNERDLSVCAICQQKHTAPVMAECRHIFCKRCFRLRLANDKTCVVCGQESAGIVKPVSADTLALLIEKSSSDNC